MIFSSDMNSFTLFLELYILELYNSTFGKSCPQVHLFSGQVSWMRHSSMAHLEQCLYNLSFSKWQQRGCCDVPGKHQPYTQHRCHGLALTVWSAIWYCGNRHDCYLIPLSGSPSFLTWAQEVWHKCSLLHQYSSNTTYLQLNSEDLS